MLKVAGAMTVVMKDAIKPNLVQTLEGQPALVHAGPFGNIAHAANSIIADRIALKAADYVVTEAGFASDLGFQKFCDIVCRVGGFAPSAAVLVTTVRATKSHGGKPFKDLAQEDLTALRKGADNLAAHVNIVRQYGLPCVVAINASRPTRRRRWRWCASWRCRRAPRRWSRTRASPNGGAGAVELAKAVVTACDKPNTFQFLTPPGTPIAQQIEAIATKLYGAANVDLESQARKDLEKIEKLGLGHGAGVHGQVAPVAVARPEPAQPADGLHAAGARAGAERRRRLRGGALRRDAAHARARQDAGVPQHRHRREREHGRTVLGFWLVVVACSRLRLASG